MTRIAFAEIEGWEEAYVRRELSEHELLLSTELAGRLDGLEDIEILSPFVHSRLDASFLDRLPRLRLIATRSTGFDHIDLEAARARGIVASNVPTYGSNTVAEHTFALILALTRKLVESAQRAREGTYDPVQLCGRDLRGKTLGVVGAGHIGSLVARIARGFGMRVLAHDPRPDIRLADALDFRYAGLEELLAESDVVSLHAPYTPANHHLMSRERLGQMKRGAFLVNTARGGLIDTAALLEVVEAGHLGGAGLDVLEEEATIREEAEILGPDYDRDRLQTVIRNHILLRHPRVIITPHNAFNSEEAVHRIVETTVGNIRAFLAGEPRNVL